MCTGYNHLSECPYACTSQGRRTLHFAFVIIPFLPEAPEMKDHERCDRIQ